MGHSSKVMVASVTAAVAVGASSVQLQSNISWPVRSVDPHVAGYILIAAVLLIVPGSCVFPSLEPLDCTPLAQHCSSVMEPASCSSPLQHLSVWSSLTGAVFFSTRAGPCHLAFEPTIFWHSLLFASHWDLAADKLNFKDLICSQVAVHASAVHHNMYSSFTNIILFHLLCHDH